MSVELSLQNIACERGDRMLFQGLNLQLKGGQGLRVVGANGSGKTTLLRAIAGLSQRFDGEISWCGERATSFNSTLKSDLLYFGHAPGIKTTLTALENLNWWQLLNLSKPRDTEYLIKALKAIGLSDYIHSPCHQLSAGQQRRVALARLLINNHRLWILDEPFTAIDKTGVAMLENEIDKQLQRGGIVILTTHQPLNNVKLLTLDIDNLAVDQPVSSTEVDR